MAGALCGGPIISVRWTGVERLIYKYLPLRYAKRMLTHGEVLFRTLSYFRAVEHRARGDEVEGIHIDAPGHPTKLENLSTGRTMIGAWKFLNSIDQSRVFALCCSTHFSEALFHDFGVDACVAISDPDTFFRRCQTKARAAFPSHGPAILHRAVEYWAPDRESPLPVKDPDSIPFLKHEAFATQAEYRATFALQGGRQLLERVVHGRPSFSDEIEGAQVHEKILVLGSLRGIAQLLTSGDVSGRAT